MWKVKSQNNSIQGIFTGFLIEQVKTKWDDRYQVFGYLNGTTSLILLGYYGTFERAENITDSITRGRTIYGESPEPKSYLMPQE